MRLWHKDLISVLPRQQLLAQWRECCCIARNISVNGTPNHLLVNKVLEYNESHLYMYGLLINAEMINRNYKCNISKFTDWMDKEYYLVEKESLFVGWHNERYLEQCYYNLQEKYDCGGISDSEWKIIEERVMQL